MALVMLPSFTDLLKKYADIIDFQKGNLPFLGLDL